MADNFFKTRNGILLGSLSSAPSNPTNGDFYYDTTLNKFRRYENGAWGSFGSGSGGGTKNYLSSITASTASGVANTGNGDLEGGSTSGFSLGTVTLTSNFPSGVPTFGSGASGNLSLTSVSSGQIAGLYSLGYVSSAATTAGNFVASDAFFIDLEDQAKVLNFSFAYKAFSGAANGNFSGTSSNSFGIAIYDVTNSAWIQPAGVFNVVQNSGVGISFGSFQTSSNGTQYRIVVYNANATSGAITMYFDDFVVGPSNKVLAPTIADAVSFTPTGSWTSNTTYTGTYARVGDKLHCQVYLALAGAPTSTSLTVNLPSGLSIDTTKLPSINGNQIEGSGAVVSAGVGYVAYPFYNSSTSILVKASNNSFNPVTQSFPATFANNDWVSINFIVPISGWSSNAVSSSDTDTRVIAARFKTAAGQSTTSSPAVVNFDSIDYDTAGAVTTGGSWNFKAPVSGKYNVRAMVTFNTATYGSGVTTFIDLYKNGSQISNLAKTQNGITANSQTITLNGSDEISLVAGDTIDVRVSNNGSVALTANNVYNYVAIERVSGPSVVQANETVAARYKTASGTYSNGTDTIINFDTADFDTHAAVTTGASWQFAAPVSGIYEVSAEMLTDTTTNAGSMELALFKNGSRVSMLFPSLKDSSDVTQRYGGNGSTLVKLIAGDTINVHVSNNSGGTRTFINDSTYNSVSIRKLP